MNFAVARKALAAVTNRDAAPCRVAPNRRVPSGGVLTREELRRAVAEVIG